MAEGQTEDTHPNAGRASGYTDEQGHAIGENLVNRVTELMVGPQTKIIQLAAQMDASAKLQDQRFHYVLGQLAAFLEKEDERHSAYDLAETSTLAALTSVALRLDEITGYVQQSVTIAREALTVSKAGTARLGKLEKRVMRIDARDARQYTHTKRLFKESQDDRQNIHQAIATLEAKLDTYIAGSKREEVEDLRREIDILKQARGDGDR